MPNLQSLNLENKGFGDAGANAIAAVLKDVPQLQTLSLGSNGIGEAGARAIAAVLKDVPQLQTLKLGDNSIGEAGANRLEPDADTSSPALAPRSLFLYCSDRKD